jgi:hypothetical protein
MTVTAHVVYNKGITCHGTYLLTCFIKQAFLVMAVTADMFRNTGIFVMAVTADVFCNTGIIFLTLIPDVCNDIRIVLVLKLLIGMLH